jgi:peptide/nickel transport system permease protein
LFGFMLGGAVLVEQLFGMPGMGQYVVNAVNTSDFVSLEGFLLVVAALSLIVFLLVDIVNMLVDPRRRPGQTEGSSL